MKAIRLALLTEIPAPYRIPLFNALAAAEGIDLEVLFLSDRDPKRPYPVYSDEFRFPWRVLRRRELERGGRWVIFSVGVLGALRRFRPDVLVVGGWNQPAFWQAALFARLRRRPLVVWVESTARDARPASRALELAKRALVRSAAGVLVPGRASLEYVSSLGVRAERIAIAPNAVDQTIFRDRVAAARARRDELRSELGLERCTFLYVGRLDPEKGLDLLLEAMGGVAADLVVVGAGSEGERLRALAPPNTRFTGWLERDDLVSWYAAADAFVLPSRSDQWGMVLNEAAAAGLPLVSTDAPGAAHDLIEDGVNGFRVRAGDAGAFAAALERLAADGGQRRSAGERSLELAARLTPEAWAEAVAAVARRYGRSNTA